MRFLKLNNMTNEPMFVNFDKVETFYAREDGTYIDFEQDPAHNYHSIYVTEKPDEIYEMLKNEEWKKDVK